MAGASTPFLGLRRIVEEAAGNVANKNEKRPMATPSDTSLKAQALSNCSRNEHTVIRLEYSYRNGFVIVSVRLVNIAVCSHHSITANEAAV